MYRPALVAVFLLAQFTPALASGDKPAAAAPAASPPADERNTVHCHYERVTGSHITQKVCLSKAEEDARSERDRDSLRRLQQTGFSCSNKGMMSGGMSC